MAPELPASPRLMLRPMVAEDIGWLAELNASAAVMRHMNGPMSRQASQEMLDRILAYYEPHPGMGCWATLERDGGAIVGLHLLNHIRGESFVQVGYRLFERDWGKGYATEMTVAILRYGFAQLRLPQITGIVDLPNHESMRVLLKAGLHRKGERCFEHPSYHGQTLAWFERDRDDWLAERGAN